jgi:hypothetical protein
MDTMTEENKTSQSNITWLLKNCNVKYFVFLKIDALKKMTNYAYGRSSIMLRDQ